MTIKGHPVLGDLSLNFSKHNNKLIPYDVIILAGENGCGKTTLLEVISDLPWLLATGANNGRRDSKDRYNYSLDLEVRLDDNDLTITYTNGNPGVKYMKISSSPRNNEPSAFRNIKINNIYNKNHVEMAMGLGPGKTEVTNHNVLLFDSTKPKIIYSTVGIDYNFTETREIKNRKLDDSSISRFGEPISSESNAANILNELFVSICSQDGRDARQYLLDHNGETGLINGSVGNQRMERFSKAYAKVFGNKLIFKTVNDDNEVIFQKGSDSVKLKNLSSGEKQIVFRGGFLLANKGILNNPIVLIDEPEISMHPKWQDKVLGYYEKLLPKTQVFIATHSDHILEDALNGTNSLILRLNKKDKKPDLFYNSCAKLRLEIATIAEIKYHIFDIITVDYHIELFAYMHQLLQDKALITGESITSVDTYLDRDPKCPKVNSGWKNERHDKTLPVYIRNYFDHPNDKTAGRINRELPNNRKNAVKKSIKYMINKITELQKHPEDLAV